ncbi:MAG TPA: hypothetical protein VHV76_14455 [Mycobacteriales bacterium]|nr:hypothetical protein [Mycobacteriales bacterium]
MSEAMSEIVSSVRDHAPAMPSVKDAREAVRSHLPSADAVLPRAARKRSRVAVAATLLAVAAVVAGYLRSHRQATADPSPSMYTPPLPKP